MFWVQIQTVDGPMQGIWQDMDWYDTREEAGQRIADEKALDAIPPQRKYHYRIDERSPVIGDESHPV